MGWVPLERRHLSGARTVDQVGDSRRRRNVQTDKTAPAKVPGQEVAEKGHGGRSLASSGHVCHEMTSDRAGTGSDVRDTGVTIVWNTVPVRSGMGSALPQSLT